MKKNDGGPAYPEPRNEIGVAYFDVQKGMTMRQAYKMAALTGILSNPNSKYFEDCGRACRIFADAMIKEDQEFEKEKGNG